MIDFGNDRNERRERTFQMLYTADYNGELSAEELFSSFFDEGEKVPESGYLHDTFTGAVAYSHEADVKIEADSKNWSASRMSGVVRTVLRLAIYELLCTETPPRVIINEALELVKKFGEEQERAFVNGILNRIAREEGKL